MGIKRFIYNRLFNKRQRFAIWQAVLFSEYTYRRRGNVDGAAYVRTVINEVAPIAATKQRLFTADEVDAIVKARVSEAIKAADRGAQKLPQKGNKPEFRVIKVDLDKCATCQHLDECDTIPAEIKTILNHQKAEEKEESGKETTDTTQEEHKEEENKPTDTDKPFEDIDEAGDSEDSDENKK